MTPTERAIRNVRDAHSGAEHNRENCDGCALLSELDRLQAQRDELRGEKMKVDWDALVIRSQDFAAVVHERDELRRMGTRETLGKVAKEARAVALEKAARVAEAYGPARPITAPQPGPTIIGRWEGEQAASKNIAAAIRALVEK